MPTVLRVGPYRFFFYSDERQEPPHAHVESAEKRAKLWLDPLELAWNDGFRSGELSEIDNILMANRLYLLGEWHDFFKL